MGSRKLQVQRRILHPISYINKINKKHKIFRYICRKNSEHLPSHVLILSVAMPFFVL